MTDLAHPPLSSDHILELDRAYLWHPYSSVNTLDPLYPVASAKGSILTLADGTELIDGMASWWSVVHGYNHPELNNAVATQLNSMSHVMFGGLTHEPAAILGQQLVKLTPPGLDKVFLSDSGSVAVEVAMKMALQYWQAKQQPERTRFLALQKGYHGDTLGAMSACDPITGMHHLFAHSMQQHIFAEQPQCGFYDPWEEHYFDNFKTIFLENKNQLAAVILEPIVQGAGGMHFYNPVFLKRVRELCTEHNILLIADEIATGFGRTGKLFACEHADISPDILCLGKTLTAGYMTLAATLCSNHIADTICAGEAKAFMHGPTYMANPLACAVANKNIELLLKNDHWLTHIQRLEIQLRQGLAPCAALDNVNNVRVLGGIGVVEMKQPVKLADIQPKFVAQGIWLRPFGKLIYMIPSYTINNEEIALLTHKTFLVIKSLNDNINE